MFRGGNFEDPGSCWGAMSFTFKFYFISTLAIILTSMIIPLCVLFLDVPLLTIFSLQIWRPLFSFWGNLNSAMAIINVLFAFLWMMGIMEDKKKSTVYSFMEAFLINLKIHLLFTLTVIVYSLIFGSESVLFGYGWFPIILVYEFHQSALEPEADRQFCCLPFRIKNKHFPWVLVLFLGLLSMQLLCILCAAFVGYVEGYVIKRNFFDLPAKAYHCLEKILPNSIKTRPDFVPISSASNFPLSGQAGPNARPAPPTTTHQVNNPFNAHANEPVQEQAKVKVGGKAVAIGGNSNAMSYQDMWKMRQLQDAQKEQAEKETPKQQFEIEPSTSSYNPKKHKQGQYQTLHDESNVSYESKPKKQNSDDLL